MFNFAYTYTEIVFGDSIWDIYNIFGIVRYGWKGPGHGQAEVPRKETWSPNPSYVDCFLSRNATPEWRTGHRGEGQARHRLG